MDNFLFNRTIKALCLTLCGEEEEILRHVEMTKVVERVNVFILSLPLFYRVLFYLNLLLLEWSIPPISLKILPFSWLRLEQRVIYLQGWQGSPFYWKRIVFKLISSPCLMSLFAEEALLEKIGFGPSMKSRRVGHAKSQ